jgi:hypothetical protein
MNYRSEREIERMRTLFHEIGTELDPVENSRAAQLLVEPEDARKHFEMSDECGKLTYPSEAQARQVIKASKRRGAGNLRSYKCEKCHGFHITSYFAKAR